MRTSLCVSALLFSTISAHALGQALLQAAVLAAVATGPVDLTVALPGAGVRHGGLLAASEKSLMCGQHKDDSE